MLLPIQRFTIYQSQSPVSINGESIPNFEPLAMQFYSCNEVEINNSWDQITQTAKIVLPRKIVAIGSVPYSFNEYDTLNPNTFTANIQKQICGTNSNIPKKTITLIDNKIPSPTYSLIFNPNINNGSRFVGNNRYNGLIQHGDMVVIQCGYMIEQIDQPPINTLINGNVGNQTSPLVGGGNNILSVNLPPTLQKAPNVTSVSSPLFTPVSYYNIDNRWKPFNRGYQFRGYVSKISINKEGNVEINCEDLMYLYNRAKFPNAVYNPSGPSGKIQPFDYLNNKTTSGWTVNNIIVDSIQGRTSEGTQSGIQNYDYLPRQVIPSVDDNNIPQPGEISIIYNQDIDMLVGKITTTNAAVGDLFKTLKDSYNIPVFFRPNTNILVSTPFMYNQLITTPSPIKGVGYTRDLGSTGQEEFTFIMGQWSINSEETLMADGFLRNAPTGTYKNRQNIINSDLQFKYTDDQPVGAIVKSIYKIDLVATPEQGASTADGRVRKTPIEYSVPVGDAGGQQYTFFYLVTKSDVDNSSPDSINPGSPQNIFVNGVVNKANLTRAMKDYGNMLLSHFNYSGFYGSFVTYGYPYVQMCDIVNIADLSFPERSGRYYVKQVIYRGSTDHGFTQQIFLDYKLPNKNINE